MNERKPESIRDRIRAHASPKTEENTVTQDRIEREDNESDLTTADLARSAETETEERREEQRRENYTSENRNMAGTTRDAVRTGSDVTPRPSGASTSGASTAAVAAAPAREGDSAPLFSPDDARNFRSRWENLQVSFVDEPRRAVEQADSLVAEAIKRLAEVFADERQKLEKQWDRGDNVSTEDLRVALQRYRAFFGRLLSV